MKNKESNNILVVILVENSKIDSYWGIGKKGTGKNKLGKLLMKIRKECNKKVF